MKLLSKLFLFSGLFFFLHVSTSLASSSTPAAPFIPHTEDKPMQSYLAMNLPYGFYQGLLQKVERREGLTLKNRGEAHITVISPVEFDQVLKKHLTITEINAIAEKANIQKTKFKNLCIGRGHKELQGHLEKTYFVVVEAPGLLKIREQVAAAYQARGGLPQDFKPSVFYPHVTLGFTARDLHLEDGVVKNKSACIADLPL